MKGKKKKKFQVFIRNELDNAFYELSFTFKTIPYSGHLVEKFFSQLFITAIIV